MKRVEQLKQFIYGEICMRRPYSASRTYEEVINKIDELFPEMKDK